MENNAKNAQHLIEKWSPGLDHESIFSCFFQPE